MTVVSSKKPSRTRKGPSNRPISESGKVIEGQHCVAAAETLTDSAGTKKVSKVFAFSKSAAAGDEIFAEGGTAPSGHRWIKLVQNRDTVWVARQAFSGQAHSAEEQMARAGIVLIGSGMKSRLLRQVAAIKDFPARFLIERSGWAGNQYALPNGEVIASRGQEIGEIVFQPDTTKCGRMGSLGSWKRDVAEPLIGQVVPSFMLMAAFAGPMLALTDRTENFGFELVGHGGAGKTTLLHLAASVVGAPSNIVSMDATLAGLEGLMPAHSDLPMFLDEANLFVAGIPESGHAKAVRDLVFKLTSGQIKARYKSLPMDTKSSFVFMISANESFAEVTRGARTDAYRAAADRLRTIAVQPDSAFGVFGPLPEGTATSGELVETLLRAANAHHGKPMRCYIRNLVRRKADDEDRLRSRIRRFMAEFRREAGINENDGSARRVADAFGLVAAAGSAAISYGALPRGFACFEVAMHCYRNNRPLST